MAIERACAAFGLPGWSLANRVIVVAASSKSLFLNCEVPQAKSPFSMAASACPEAPPRAESGRAATVVLIVRSSTTVSQGRCRRRSRWTAS